MKKCIEICEMLFKNWKLLFENTHQTPPKCLVKTIKKCFLKNCVLLTLIKVAVWIINYQKVHEIYNFFFVLITSLNASYRHNIFTIKSIWQVVNGRKKKKIIMSLVGQYENQ